MLQKNPPQAGHLTKTRVQLELFTDLTDHHLSRTEAADVLDAKWTIAIASAVSADQHVPSRLGINMLYLNSNNFTMSCTWNELWDPLIGPLRPHLGYIGQA
ncbi:hypothetical protein SRHO_G00015540 [Serrasalmus rhombeus]